MSKTIKLSKHNTASVPKTKTTGATSGLRIGVSSAPAVAINPIVMKHGVEMYPNYSCGKPKTPIDRKWHCYYIDLQYVTPYYGNHYELPRVLARCFIDEGMRVFVEPCGVMCACNLDERTFYAKFEANIQSIFNEAD